MSVRVTPSLPSVDPNPFTHADATTFSVDDDDRLHLFAEGRGTVATYARGCWASAEKVPEPADDGLAEVRERAKRATEQVLIHEGWTPPGGFESLNAAASPDPRVTDPGDPRYGDGSRLTASSEPYGAVLSETTEPYVSVNLSVTSDSSAEVLKVIKEALRNGSLTIPTKALA